MAVHVVRTDLCVLEIFGERSVMFVGPDKAYSYVLRLGSIRRSNSAINRVRSENEEGSNHVLQKCSKEWTILELRRKS